MADHVANRNAHTKLNLPLRRHHDRRCPHRLLNGERAYDGVDGALKLDDETVAHSAHELPFAFRDTWIDDIAPDRGESGVRAPFIRSHQPRVTDDVGAQDDSRSIFKTVCAHRPCISLNLLPNCSPATSPY